MKLNEFREVVRKIVKEEIQHISKQKYVNETKGISPEVEELAHDFARDILEIVREKEYDYNQRFYRTSEIYDCCDVFGIDIALELNICFCRNWIVYNEECKGRAGEYKYDNKNRIVVITVYVVGDRIIANSLETKLAHEFRHIQQYAMYHKDKGDYLMKSSYYKATSQIGQGGLRDAVSNVIYLSSRFENEAYGQELYNELMNSNKPIEQVFKESNSYKAYESLVNDLKIMIANKNNRELHNILKEHGHQYDHVVRKGKNTCGRFHKRLIKAYAQAVEDRNKQKQVNL